MKCCKFFSPREADYFKGNPLLSSAQDYPYNRPALIQHCSAPANMADNPMYTCTYFGHFQDCAYYEPDEQLLIGATGTLDDGVTQKIALHRQRNYNPQTNVAGATEYAISVERQIVFDDDSVADAFFGPVEIANWEVSPELDDADADAAARTRFRELRDLLTDAHNTTVDPQAKGAPSKRSYFSEIAG